MTPGQGGREEGGGGQRSVLWDSLWSMDYSYESPSRKQ